MYNILYNPSKLTAFSFFFLLVISSASHPLGKSIGKITGTSFEKSTTKKQKLRNQEKI